MIIDACRRLRAFGPLSRYEYVGFGGFEFVDFDLVRRALGVERMVSYEKDSSALERYEFNRPFGEIQLKFGAASTYLPFLDRVTMRIVWLDYLQSLDNEVLQDLETSAELLAPGSLLICTVNATPAKPADERRNSLASLVGEDRIPLGVTDDSLGQWGLAAVQRRIVVTAVNEALARRGDGSFFEQLFFFNYADGAQMLTWGGMILLPALSETFETARFDELDQVRRGTEACQVLVPALTVKEALHLNAQLPAGDGVALDAPGLLDQEKLAYAKAYRWYPPVPAPI
jgi:hypothetical protein